METGLGH